MAHGLSSTAREQSELTMVCYARPAGAMAFIVLVVLVVFGRMAGHFFATAALIITITVAAGSAVVAATLALAVFLSVRRRRALTGGCVSCQLRCQHAMTELPRRLPVVSIVERSPAPPRWPDRPAYRSGPASRAALAAPPAVQAERLERTGSAREEGTGVWASGSAAR
jgi:hypothetical protein